jgi:hypothetical protein
MKNISLSFILCAALVILTGCAPSAEQIQAALNETQAGWTPIPTFTPYATLTPYPTYTNVPTIAIEVTRVVIVTPTETPTPLFTPTITYTPTDTPTATLTPNATQTAEAILQEKLIAKKGDGFYLVGIDIAPGVWRSTGTNDNCYWAVTDKTGDIISNHFGMAGGTAYIPATGYQIEFDDCGTWEYLGP